MSRSPSRSAADFLDRESMLDEAVLGIVRDIMLRNVGGPVRPTQDELATLAGVKRWARAPFGTKCFVHGALAWLESEAARDDAAEPAPPPL